MVTENAALDRITRSAKTASYVPHVWTGNRLGLALDGRPRFTWLEAERMRYDPQIQFGLRVLRAPLFGVTWKVQADSAVVERWVDREFGRVYRRMLPRLCREFEYGVACGEVTYLARRSRATGKTRIHFNDFLDLHPRDARPLVFHRGRCAGDLAGLKVQNVVNAEMGTGGLYLDRNHGFWFKGESEYGDWYGRPRLAGAYEPWLEKRGRHGAVDARRLFYKKCAFRGPRIRYPVGQTDMGNADTGSMLMSNQDIARELVEKFENGGVLALPSVKGPDGAELWTWEDPQSFSDVAGLMEYPRQLDKEILIGLGIPIELVEAGGTGSGYSGRAIPAQVFFTSMDEIVSRIVESITEQVMRFLVRLNFGTAARFEIVPDSLAQMMAQAGQQQGPPGAPPGGGGGGGNMMPYQGPRGGLGIKDPRTGRVMYGADRMKKYLRLSHAGGAEEYDDGPVSVADLPEVNAAELWAASESPVYAPAGADRPKSDGAARAPQTPKAVQMSWKPYTGPKGGRGWISDFGEVRYQEQPPDDSEETPERGPAALFDHSEYAGRTTGTVDHATAHKSFTMGAHERGFDPAEVHRRAAQILDYHLNAQKHAGRTPDRSAALDHAYGAAHDQLSSELEDKKLAAQFADTYFDGATGAERAQAYLDHVDAAGSPFVKHLDADTREAIADDLSHLPAEQLAGIVAQHGIEYGEGDPVFELSRAAVSKAAKRNPVKPEQLTDETADIHDMIFVSDHNSDALAGLHAAATVVPGAVRTKFLPPNKGLLLRGGGPMEKAVIASNEKNFGAGQILPMHDNETEHAALFDALQSANEVPQTEVPASAKNYGGVSGAGGSGDFQPEKEWNPDNVPVYKRFDDDWYMVRWGDAHPENTGFEFVHRSKVPPLSRLPEPYWKNFNTGVLDAKTGTLYQNAEGIEKNEKRLARATPEESAAKKAIGDHTQNIRAAQSEIRRAREEWHRALAGVPEDKRPDEPDWSDAPDASALSDQYDSREDHAAALEELHGQLAEHRDGLRRQIENAKNFAQRYHNRRKPKAQKKPAASVQVQASRDELQAIRDALAGGGDPAAALAKLDELLKRAGGG